DADTPEMVVPGPPAPGYGQKPRNRITQPPPPDHWFDGAHREGPGCKARPDPRNNRHPRQVITDSCSGTSIATPSPLKKESRMSHSPSLRQLAWFLAFGLGLTLAAQARADATLGRYPTLHGDSVVFEAHGNLWQVSRNGGKAER